MEPNWKPSQNSTAYHEAGHIVAALQQGRIVRSATIEHIGNCAGQIDPDWSEEQRERKEFPNSVIVRELFAGFLGESITGQIFCVGARTDIKRAQSWACQELFGDEWRKHTIVQQLGSESFFLPRSLQSFLGPCYEESCQLIQRNESMVCAFAEELKCKGTMNREEIDELFGHLNQIQIATI